MAFAVSCTKPEEPDHGGDNNGQNDTVVDHSGSLNNHDYVDLGLPSGLMWATCNVGAETPEAYGAYFAWGETETKDYFDWKSYRYGNFLGDRYELYKYCSDSAYSLDGFVDELTLLESTDDAALACWGTGWRTPTIEEWDEMFQHTSYEFTSQNGVDGWCFTASNGNSLFLPDAGYWWDGSFNHGGLGLYWSSSLNTLFPCRSWSFHFNAYQCHLCGSSDRNRGQSVRPVCRISALVK